MQDAAATLTVDLTSYSAYGFARAVQRDRQHRPEMSAQVEKLIAGDQQLLEQMTRFHEDLHSLAAAPSTSRRTRQARRATPAARGRRHRPDPRFKKQQAAADSWLAEAHFRDRGVKD